MAMIGPCSISLRLMEWYDSRAREFRESIDRAWVYSVRHHTNIAEAETLAEGVFEVGQTRYEGGLRQAQEHAVEIAREFTPCKRMRRTREALDPTSVEWLEHRLLDSLRTSYDRWRENNARYGRGVYPEPRWSTALLADEAAQYHRPDDLEVPDRRFYSLVRTTLERLRRRGLIVGSTGLDNQGRETTLWEPA